MQVADLRLAWSRNKLPQGLAPIRDDWCYTMWDDPLLQQEIEVGREDGSYDSSRHQMA